jgi:hypothetical protein
VPSESADPWRYVSFWFTLLMFIHSPLMRIKKAL